MAALPDTPPTGTATVRPPASLRDPTRHAAVWIPALLAVAIVAVFAPVAGFEFINFDDPDYVTDNPMVRQGLTWAGAVWAFSDARAANWHPLTWLSHMLDVSVWGLNPAGHHLTNLACHVAAAALLYLALARLTARWMPSAAVATLFALHPMRVESVAWVAERKDVLSGAATMATLWAYAAYAERPSPRRYGVVLAGLGAALLAKPMAVTLPFVLLLLDVWPLARWRDAAIVREKLPLFALVAALSVITFIVQRDAGAMASLESLPWSNRLANATVAYVAYVRKLVWPWPLAPFYPLQPLAPLLVASAAAVLVAISALVAWLWPRAPYAAVGWCWYLGTLVPVIGLVKVGDQAMADRFTYVPHVGLLIAIVYGIDAAATRRPTLRPGVLGTFAVAIVSAGVASAHYLPEWSTSERLFRHALTVTEGNYVAETNYAAALASRGARDEAITHYRAAIAIAPAYAKAYIGLGAGLLDRGNLDGAATAFTDALAHQPRLAVAHFDLGTVRLRQARLDEAAAALAEAITIDPLYVRAHHQLGDVRQQQGDHRGAIAAYRHAIALAPGFVASHANLAIALEDAGDTVAAIAEYRAAVALAPDHAPSHANLGAALEATGDRAGALAAYQSALRLRPVWPEVTARVAALRATP